MYPDTVAHRTNTTQTSTVTTMSATKLISFEGASDDLAYVIVDGRPEEYSAYEGAQFHVLSAHGGQLQVGLELERDSGCWGVTIGQTDETHPLPKWPIRLTQSPDTDYATRVTITAPADATVVSFQ